MKIRITEPGWQGFTGYMGAVEFKDAVSVEDVSQAEASRLSAIIKIENADTGANPSDAQKIIDTYANKAPVEVVHSITEQAGTTIEVSVVYTRAELEKIADEKGIKGVREIADGHGLKGNSISELINKVLAAQELAVPAPAATEEAAAPAADEAQA